VSKKVTRDPEVIRLRGRLRVDDPAEKRRRREELERYQHAKKVREAEALLREERRRALVAAGLDPDVEVQAS
jgi:hypothetical protein